MLIRQLLLLTAEVATARVIICGSDYPLIVYNYQMALLTVDVYAGIPAPQSKELISEITSNCPLSMALVWNTILKKQSSTETG